MVSTTGVRWWSLAAAGAAVIALCYGFARYAYGLFAPRFGEAFGLAPAAVGVLGGLSTAGYGLGLLAAPVLSPRGAVVVAGASATAGLGVMAVAPGVVVFGAGIVLAGVGAGLVSPGVAGVLAQAVQGADGTRAQTWANTGTGFGLAASAFTPLLVVDWRVTWGGFAVLGVVVTLVVWRVMPSGSAVGGGGGTTGGAWVLMANSVLIGVTSAPYWTFSSTRLSEAGLGSGVVTWCWFSIGAAGLLGGMAGRAAQRYGVRRATLAAWALAFLGIGSLALPGLGVGVALVSSVLFGASYMALTGLCILWATEVWPERPARGVTWSFAGLAIGQTVASPLAGAAAGVVGLAVVFGVAGLAALLGWAQVHPKLSSS
ncbi:YbfB/YjiJ family MFS transporter [Actinokineospora bangkokensis]|uniref:MFS transporter n=1 Tax=Actinokineospora bangkokensis TaxID=1193682 RepID=A0A1Q9LRX2_9PSEU|nr:YbfB/YjiJ family MFS transporter [Actinokineospora bangkokensis]OLR94797.1 MFS transporter [Actinokineospora bangkokensis]